MQSLSIFLNHYQSHLEHILNNNFVSVSPFIYFFRVDESQLFWYFSFNY